jgi:hypothetical protein
MTVKTKHRGLRALPIQALAGALILVVSLLATAPSASAGDLPSDNHCNYDSSFNACLRLYDPGAFLYWGVYAGLDVYFGEQYARDIIACGNSDFKASLWGDDGGGGKDDFIRDLVLQPGWPAVVPGGIGVVFDLPFIHNDDLDEDDGEDELYVSISFKDCHNNNLPRQVFRTGTIHGYF